MGKSNTEITRLHIAPMSDEPEYTPVFWHFTGTIFNDNRFQALKHIDSRTLGTLGTDWWKPYTKVKKLEIIDELSNYDFIKEFTGLESLTIINSETFNSLHLIEGMKDLAYLQVMGCHQVSDITPIINLRNSQQEAKDRAESEYRNKEGSGATLPLGLIGRFNVLSNINLTDCNISSLEPFKNDKSQSMDELHLSWNHIQDVAGLEIFSHAYLSLSHNQIEHIESLFASSERNYLEINLRHNLIKDISGVQIPQAKFPGRIKIRIKHNQIPPQPLEKWRKNDNIWLMDV